MSKAGRRRKGGSPPEVGRSLGPLPVVRDATPPRPLGPLPVVRGVTPPVGAKRMRRGNATKTSVVRERPDR